MIDVGMSGSGPRPVQWTEGASHGLVWTNGMALLDGSLTLDVATQIWAAATQQLDLAEFLEELSRASGARILELPPFAVALSAGGEWHVAARGRFEVHAVCGGNTHVVSSTGISTWSERRIDGASTVALGHVDGADEEGSQVRPTLGGVVPADRLRWSEPSDVVPSVGGETRVPVPEPFQAPEARGVQEAGGPQALDTQATLPPEADAGFSLETAAEADELSPAESQPVPETEPELESDEAQRPERESFAHLWGDTVMHSVAEAAVRNEVPDGPASADFIAGAPRPGHSTKSPPPPSPTEQIDLAEFVDHDGQTVMASSLGLSPPQSPTPAPIGPGVTVLGIVCAKGHANPPQRTHCRVCGLTVSGDPEPLPRPALGWMRSTTGEVVELSTPVIAGRNPRADRVQGPQLPRLLALPHSHISGNHLEIRLEGWNVLAVDLHSTNGTFLRRHGEPPVRLPESPVLLVDGDVLDLGHGVQLALEEVP